MSPYVIAYNVMGKVNQDAKKLLTSMTTMYHSITAKLLFSCKLARPDVQTALAFLCTHVSISDIDGYKKLKCVVCYLRRTNELYLTLEATDLCIMKWRADALFAVHPDPDMKSQTGGTMSFGKGAVYSAS